MTSRLVLGVAGAVTIIALGGAPSALAESFSLSDGIGPLAGTSKYKITVSGQAAQGSLPAAASLAARHSGGQATYFNTGHVAVSGSSLKATFGHLGSVNVTFKAQKTKTISSLAGCKGKPIKEKIGVWQGTISFTGEHGYTHIKATKAPGDVLPAHNWKCQTSPAFHGIDLNAFEPPPSGIGPAPLQFDATQATGSSTAKFVAGSTEGALTTGGGETILRSAWASGPASSTFSHTGKSSATVNPPAPFSGTGTFSAPHGWEGTLKVNFPGRTGVALEGPTWTASLSQN